MEYLVILEKTDTSVGAYVPDLPGCVAVGESRDGAMQLIREAIELHIESLGTRDTLLALPPGRRRTGRLEAGAPTCTTSCRR